MIETENEKLIRQYSAGEITWSGLPTCGFDSDLDVLIELRQLGLASSGCADGRAEYASPPVGALLRRALIDAKR